MLEHSALSAKVFQSLTNGFEYNGNFFLNLCAKSIGLINDQNLINLLALNLKLIL